MEKLKKDAYLEPIRKRYKKANKTEKEGFWMNFVRCAVITVSLRYVGCTVLSKGK